MILNQATDDEAAELVRGLHSRALRFFRADVASGRGSALEELPVDALLQVLKGVLDLRKT